jgi:hypothetical protein
MSEAETISLSDMPPDEAAEAAADAAAIADIKAFWDVPHE